VVRVIFPIFNSLKRIPIGYSYPYSIASRANGPAGSKGAANCAAGKIKRPPSLGRRHGSDTKPRTRIFFFTSGKICYTKHTGCLGAAVSHTLCRKGVVDVSAFEAMYLMIAFATLVVLIIKQK